MGVLYARGAQYERVYPQWARGIWASHPIRARIGRTVILHELYVCSVARWVWTCLPTPANTHTLPALVTESATSGGLLHPTTVHGQGCIPHPWVRWSCVCTKHALYIPEGVTPHPYSIWAVLCYWSTCELLPHCDTPRHATTRVSPAITVLGCGFMCMA